MINIIGIDPGNNTGVAIVTVNEITLEVVGITVHNVILDNEFNPYIHVDRMLLRCMVLDRVITTLINVYNPVAVCIETSFLNTRFPLAVLQLTQFTTIIQDRLRTLSPRCKVFRYMPKYIKKYIGSGGDANKFSMAETIGSIPEITKYVNTSILTEHQVDAVAIAMVAIYEIREYPYLLYAL